MGDCHQTLSLEKIPRCTPTAKGGDVLQSVNNDDARHSRGVSDNRDSNTEPRAEAFDRPEFGIP